MRFGCDQYSVSCLVSIIVYVTLYNLSTLDRCLTCGSSYGVLACSDAVRTERITCDLALHSTPCIVSIRGLQVKDNPVAEQACGCGSSFAAKMEWS